MTRQSPENRNESDMSFASQVMEEIAQRSLQLQKDCCGRQPMASPAFAKYFDARGLVLQTEQELTARVAEQLFARCGVQGTVLEKPRPSGVVYEFGIREPEQVCRMHELFGTTGSDELRSTRGSSGVRPAWRPISARRSCAAAL